METKERQKQDLAYGILKGLRITPEVHYGDFFVPPKPPIVMGYLSKLGSIFGSKNKRYFVMNPVEGTFIKYMNSRAYPSQPKDMYSIMQIQSLKRIPSANKQQFHYFEV